MNPVLPLLLCAVVPFAACSKTEPTPVPPATPGTSGGAPAADDHHGAAKALGAVTVGAHSFQVTQFGDVQAGHDAAVELEVAAGKPVPGTVRGWIGVESAQGSAKGKFGKEGDRGLHAHLEVPDPIPAGSKLWLEVEDNGQTVRGSTAWQ